jgi:AraC-like DNA-binding protein
MSAGNQLPYVRWAGVDIAMPHVVTGPRRLYDHELVYTLSGSGCVVVEQQKYSVGADHCFFLQPCQRHSAYNDNDESWVTIGVHFDWRCEPDVEKFVSFRADDGRTPRDVTLFRTPHPIPHWNLQDRPILDLRGRPLVRHFLEEVVTAFSRGDENSRDQAGGLLFAAICQLQREARLLQSGSEPGVIGPDAQRRLLDARWMLEQVAPKMPSVSEVAARVGWSADYLAFMVKTAFGVSPRAMRMNARLARARQLLREGTAVSDVARECGFSDTSHLARAFRKESGLTPREYSVLAGHR